jgi:cytochrome b subunit of formate dehydrogenase
VFAARHTAVKSDPLPRLLQLLGVVALGVLVYPPALAETAACLACHADKGPAIEFPQGGRIEAFVDERQFRASVHGFLACTDCHDQSLTGTGHEQQRFRSEELFKLRYSRICRRCHLDQELSRFAVHRSLLEQEAAGRAPVCSDCHPAHAIMPVGGGAVLDEETAYCLGCHAAQVQAEAPGEAGAGRAVPTPRIHGNLSCSGCHAGYSRRSHPLAGVAGSGSGAGARNLLCKRCHFDMYTKSLEGIHYNLLSRGHPGTPGCVDCHGSHRIISLSHDRAASAAKCGECHKALYARYASSVHGNALVNSNNQDVPICIDCHRAHDTGDPLTVGYRYDIPFMCGSCHANEAIARKYGLSADVVKTYLSDFHGSTVSIYRDEAAGADQPSRPIAVCTDCHGTHDIKSMSELGPGAVKALLLRKCRQCHQDASIAFPDAWLSHYTPSLSRTPVLFLVDRSYTVLLPLMLLGMLLHVVLHARRHVVGRTAAATAGSETVAPIGACRIRRFPATRIAEHLVLILLVAVLAATGLAQKLHALAASQWLFSLVGGVEMARRIHHYAGAALAALLLLHIATAVFGVTVRGWRMSMLISRQDLLDAAQDTRYGLGLAARPADRDWYDYKEKFTYWLVLTGVVVMVLSGAILWFPIPAASYLPGQAIALAAMMHSRQALVVLLLAIGWHIYDTIFSPDAFPLDASIFTGYTTRPRSRRSGQTGSGDGGPGPK